MRILRALRIISRKNLIEHIQHEKKILNEHHERFYKAHHEYTVECLKKYLNSHKEELAS